jgi:hypothetical protein
MPGCKPGDTAIIIGPHDDVCNHIKNNIGLTVKVIKEITINGEDLYEGKYFQIEVTNPSAKICISGILGDLMYYHIYESTTGYPDQFLQPIRGTETPEEESKDQSLDKEATHS